MTKAKKKVVKKARVNVSPAAVQKALDEIDGIKRNPLTEMMTKVEFWRGHSNHRILRVWSIAKDGDFGPDRRVMDALGTQRNPNDTMAHINQIMEKLGPDIVAAYEVLNVNGQGMVHYPDWK